MQFLLVDASIKSFVDTSNQSTMVSSSHLEVGVKKKIAGDGEDVARAAWWTGSRLGTI